MIFFARVVASLIRPPNARLEADDVRSENAEAGNQTTGELGYAPGWDLETGMKKLATELKAEA